MPPLFLPVRSLAEETQKHKPHPPTHPPTHPRTHPRTHARAQTYGTKDSMAVRASETTGHNNSMMSASSMPGDQAMGPLPWGHGWPWGWWPLVKSYGPRLRDMWYQRVRMGICQLVLGLTFSCCSLFFSFQGKLSPHSMGTASCCNDFA